MPNALLAYQYNEIGPSSNSIFGKDPIKGIKKTCRNKHGTVIAQENKSFKVK